MMLKKAEKKQFWAYVAMFGTLWGGLELTLGTFLHVLHVPKTGLIMTTLSVILLIAQRRVYPVRGLTLASALIAACIKCLSPGGIILGPVVGILSEALMIELGLFVTSRSIVTMMLAGILAVLSSQFQSLVKLWVYYGNDFVAALVKMGQTFFDIEWTSVVAWTLIGAFVGVLALIGGFAGATGWFWGKSVCERIDARIPSEPVVAQNAGLSEKAAFDGENASEDAQNGASSDKAMAVIEPFVKKSRCNPADIEQILRTRKYVVWVALITIFIQFSGSFFSMVAALVLWLFALAIWAMPVLKSIWWPKFWLITCFVSLIAGVTLAWEFGSGIDFAVAGEATARMVMRGAYVFALITWVTRCVRKREFELACQKVHLPEFSDALNTAYHLLPNWIDRLNEKLQTRPKGLGNAWRYMRESAIEILVEASFQARLTK